MSLLAQYADFIIHLDTHLLALIQSIGNWTYVILFLIIFLESGVVATPFLPGESMLFALGTLAARGAFNLPVLTVFLIIAGIAGGFVNYGIGYWIGERIVSRYSGTKFHKYITKTHDFYMRHGGKTIILARFIPIVRTYAPFVAGFAEMPLKRFVMFNVIGAIVWIAGFLYVSYFFGNLPIVKENFSLVIAGIIVVSILPAIFEFIRQQFFVKACGSK